MTKVGKNLDQTGNKTVHTSPLGSEPTTVKTEHSRQTKRESRRKPWQAVLLSFLTPGIGHLYNGEPITGLVCYLLLPFIVAGLGIAGVCTSFSGVTAGFLLILVAFLGIAAHAGMSARRRGAVSLRWFNRWYVYVLVILVTQLLVYPFVWLPLQKATVGSTYRIPSGTMQPALVRGDHIFTAARMQWKRPISRGDIITFIYPDDPSKIFIKRVIGLGGESIAIRNKKVFINGRELTDPWGIHLDTETRDVRDNMDPVAIPKNHVFVLGDNRDYSHDSRFWGTLPEINVKEKAQFIYWSSDTSRIGKTL